MPSTSDVPDRLVDLLAPVVSDLGLDLEGVEVRNAGRRRVLRVAVDKDGGLDLDDVAEATRVVSKSLDDQDAMGERAYTLEVSSPGVDRPLTLPRHWRRNRTRLVEVTPVDGEAWVGRVLDSDDEAATLQVGDDEVRVPYAEVKQAKVEIEFK